MTLNDFIQEIVIFCEKETQKIIVDLQRIRFANDGAFNDNERWHSNSAQVFKDKGFNKPLVDSGELERELETADNWDLKPKFSDNVLTLSIPETEQFTDSKYDKLQTGGDIEPYVSRRGNKIYLYHVPARNFKNLSNADINWIKKELVEAIKREFA